MLAAIRLDRMTVPVKVLTQPAQGSNFPLLGHGRQSNARVFQGEI